MSEGEAPILSGPRGGLAQRLGGGVEERAQERQPVQVAVVARPHVAAGCGLPEPDAGEPGQVVSHLAGQHGDPKGADKTGRSPTRARCSSWVGQGAWAPSPFSSPAGSPGSPCSPAPRGVLRSTSREHLGKSNAANLKRAHALLESGRTIGKLVLSGF